MSAPSYLNLRPSTFDMVDGLDGALFSGDEFIANPKARHDLREYLSRWASKLDELQAEDIEGSETEARPAPKFSEILDEYLDLRASGPDESSGYSDKSFYERRQELRDAMDKARGSVKI